MNPRNNNQATDAGSDFSECRYSSFIITLMGRQCFQQVPSGLPEEVGLLQGSGVGRRQKRMSARIRTLHEEVRWGKLNFASHRRRVVFVSISFSWEIVSLSWRYRATAVFGVHGL